MIFECFNNEVVLSCDESSILDWRKVLWMEARLISQYDMRTKEDWPQEFLIMYSPMYQDASTLNAWCEYQSDYYDREMNKAVPNEDPRWKGDEYC
jgi:hypothetical protein